MIEYELYEMYLLFGNSLWANQMPDEGTKPNARCVHRVDYDSNGLRLKNDELMLIIRALNCLSVRYLFELCVYI